MGAQRGGGPQRGVVGQRGGGGGGPWELEDSGSGNVGTAEAGGQCDEIMN